MNRVVIDTNVLVSALLADGPPAAIVDLIAEGKLKVFYNDLILAEYWKVLTRPKFDFHPLQVTRLIDNIMRTGIAAETESRSVIIMIDEADRKFYDAAKASLALLITGNIKHFPRESFIVTPSDFLKAYRQRAVPSP